ncbi:MAG: hypothetical protein ACI9JN_001281 [Bacteroidia bacterium]|jgi:hypothetical protein
MSKFTKLSTVGIHVNPSQTKRVEIVKFQKEGTKMVFFTPEVNGMRLVRTMFARKSGAVDIAKQYLSRN